MPVLDLSEYRLNDVGDGYSTLAGLKTLVDIASKVPRSAIESSWEILARNLITAAKARGFKASVAGSELKQAVDPSVS